MPVSEAPSPVPADVLRSAVRSALGDPHAVPGPWEAVPLTRGASGRRCHLLRGVAGPAPPGGSAGRPWSLVLKEYPVPAGPDDPAGAPYARREPLLYASGLLERLGRDVAAPACHGRDEPSPGVVRLWLECFAEGDGGRWAPADWAAVARSLGRWHGGYAAGRPAPEAPWLRRGRLRTILDGQGTLVRRIAAARALPEVRGWWPAAVVDALERLWRERGAFCDALDRLPHTFAHGDAIRRNLFALRGPCGSPRTGAIDWEHAGHYALGEEVGQTLSVAAVFFDADPEDLAEIDAALFHGYLAGLADAGWRGDPRPVRLGYAAHAALRNAFNAVGATVADEAGRASALLRYGHSWEELAERRAAVRPYLLRLAQEARDLADGTP
jgi:hypothetical protein